MINRRLEFSLFMSCHVSPIIYIIVAVSLMLVNIRNNSYCIIYATLFFFSSSSFENQEHIFSCDI